MGTSNGLICYLLDMCQLSLFYFLIKAMYVQLIVMYAQLIYLSYSYLCKKRNIKIEDISSSKMNRIKQNIF
uniref:Uncharacterized protein n=1 Tax=Anguilla anguilla TaxID=7936 RepID=A0A0E9WQ49_ANGAN